MSLEIREYIGVPSNSGNLSDNEIKAVRVDRELELSEIIHLITKASENVLIIGDRGQGKTFITRLFYLHLIENRPDIFPVQIDLTALHFYADDSSFLRRLPQLILDQLCKEIWVKLFKNNYSELLSTKTNNEKTNTQKSESEKRLIEIHNILKREEMKFKFNSFSSLESSQQIKSEIHLGENQEWQCRLP